MSFKLEPADLPPKHLKLIGQIIAEWARIESIIDLGLWGCLGLSHSHGRAVTSQISFHNRAALFKHAAEGQLTEAQLSKLSALLDAAAKSLERRNIVAHALWTISDLQGSPILSIAERTKRGHFETTKTPFTTAGMKQTAESIRKLTEDFVKFLDATVNTLPPSPGRFQ